ncbi:hypothetical protein [Flavobacterium sp.]|uniref:hypothetical protein n=1 Tax=Flavobacterium sp. TaxID=239 RepID=UPI001B452218|nr:hypothetical protein [Flavobacterium sp.]MBP6127428.1 hypothetical protein [Flavobacterium sp.]
MKNLILLLLTTFVISCCNKGDDEQPKTELEKLPPATQTGANTAGCLVNGVAFLPKGYFTTGNLVCYYIDGKDFTLGIRESIIQGGNENIRTILISSFNQNLHDNVGVTFPLIEYGANSKSGEYVINAVASPDPGYYSSNSIITGEFKITYHNYNNAILSGTFWYDAINSNGEIVKVREGRFDMHY